VSTLTPPGWNPQRNSLPPLPPREPMPGSGKITLAAMAILAVVGGVGAAMHGGQTTASSSQASAPGTTFVPAPTPTATPVPTPVPLHYCLRRYNTGEVVVWNRPTDCDGALLDLVGVGVALNGGDEGASLDVMPGGYTQACTWVAFSDYKGSHDGGSAWANTARSRANALAWCARGKPAPSPTPEPAGWPHSEGAVQP
jgi:hypothetical protein